MGSFSYGPKHYNPNWSQYSSKEKNGKQLKIKKILKVIIVKILQKKNQK